MSSEWFNPTEPPTTTVPRSFPNSCERNHYVTLRTTIVGEVYMSSPRSHVDLRYSSCPLSSTVVQRGSVGLNSPELSKA